MILSGKADLLACRFLARRGRDVAHGAAGLWNSHGAGEPPEPAPRSAAGKQGVSRVCSRAGCAPCTRTEQAFRRSPGRAKAPTQLPAGDVCLWTGHHSFLRTLPAFPAWALCLLNTASETFALSSFNILFHIRFSWVIWVNHGYGEKVLKEILGFSCNGWLLCYCIYGSKLKSWTSLEPAPLPKITVCFFNINMRGLTGTRSDRHSWHRKEA